MLLTRYKVTSAVLLVMAMIAGTVSVVLASSQVFAGASTITLELESEGPYVPGSIVKYRVTVACSSLETACGSSTITQILDENLIVTRTDSSDGWDLNLDGQTFTAYNENFVDGDSAEFKIRAVIGLDIEPGTTIPASAQIEITDVDEGHAAVNVTDIVNVTVDLGKPDYSVSKSKKSNLDPLPGGRMAYEARFCAHGFKGNTDLSQLKMVDTFPEGAVIVDAGGGAVSGNTITWDLPDVDLSSISWNYNDPDQKKCFGSRTYTLEFPADKFPEGAKAINTLDGEGVGPDGPVDIPGSSKSVTIASPTVKVTAKKNLQSGLAVAGTTGTYVITADTGESNNDVPNLVVEDEVTLDYKISKLSVGNVGSGDYRMDMSYSTDNAQSWVDLGTDLSIGTVIGDDVIPDSGITNIRWHFYRVIDGEVINSVAPGFNPKPKLDFAIPAGAAIGDEFSNCANVTFGTDGSERSCSNDVVTKPRSPDFSKSVKRVAPNSPKPTGTTKVKFRFQNSSGVDAINPVITDLLPENMEFVSFDLSDSQTTFNNIVPKSEPKFEVIENYNDTGRTLVRLSWPGAKLVAKEWYDSAFVTFWVRIKPGTPAGDYKNTANFSHDGTEPDCKSLRVDVNDLDGDGNTTERLCAVDQSYEVINSASIEAEKWVIGDESLSHVDVVTREPRADCPDLDGYTRFPCVARTKPDGDATYRLNIVSTGNQSISDLVVYDVLPHIGDTGVSETLAGGSRKTEWVPVLDGPLQPDAKASSFDPVIQYSLSSNPCRPELAEGSDESGWQTECVDDWTTSPADYSKVKAFRIRIPFDDAKFEALDELNVIVPMSVPAGAPYESVAWNSIGHRSTNSATGERLLAAEPRKVGILIPSEDEIPVKEKFYRLGNLVWVDQDDDGVAESDEPGVSGVAVSAYRDDDDTPGPSAGDTKVAVQVTDGDGHYQFENLSAGDYYVAIEDGQEVLDGWTSSTDDTTEPTADTDNDDNGFHQLTTADDAPTNGLYSSVVTLGENDGDSEPTDETLRQGDTTDDDNDDFADNRSNLSVDFGYYQLRLGNRVWLDTGDGANTNNATIDDDESPVSGALVELWQDTDKSGDFDPDSDTRLGTTTTNGEGFYWFDGLKRGIPYIVALPESGNTGEGEALEGLESSLGQFADSDNRDDGAPQTGYASVSNPVTLIPATTTTEESEGDTSADSEAGANAATGNLPDNNSELTVDFGFIEPPVYRLGNLVWEDLDNDGVAETGEPGIEGIEVVLYLDDDGIPGPSAGDTKVDTQTTDEDGHYLFEELEAGDYYVSIPSDQDSLDGFRSSSNGEEDNADSDGDNNDNGTVTTGSAVTSSIVTLGNGNGFAEPTDESLRSGSETGDEDGEKDDRLSNLTVDFGFYRLSLGNQVWFDTNNNGVIDEGEAPVPGVSVELYIDADGDGVPDSDIPIDLALTDENGNYLFTGLEEGTYVVAIPSTNFETDGPLEGHFSSSPDPKAVDTDSDDDGIDPTEQGGTVYSRPVTLDAGTEPTGEDPDNDPDTPDTNENLTVDFGFYTMTLGNRVWFDSDNDGTQDEGEDGLSGVEIQLWIDADGDGEPDSDTPAAVTITDEGGNYLFTGLEEGTYLVSIPDTQWDEGQPLEDFDLSPGGGTDGDDTDNNGIDPGERGKTIWSSPVTLDAGNAPTGEAIDNGVDGVPDENQDLSVDFGFHTMSLGNRVWIDNVDNNGVIDDGEPGVGGVTVQLIDPETGEVVATTTTDGEGYYLFTGLSDGDEYVVRIPASEFAEGGPLTGYVSTEGNGETPPDPDDDTDSDDNGAGEKGANVDSAPITLTAGGEATGETDLPTDSKDSANDENSNQTVDFGFVTTPELSLGNRLWFDLDNSGERDEGEAGSAGVTVELFRDADGDGQPDSDVPFQTTVTDENGYYLFDGLTEGDYLVRIPSSEFGEDGPLQGWYSSTGSAEANEDIEDDDSGIDPENLGGDVWSSVVSLSSFDEPKDEGDKPDGDLGFDKPSDDNANMTVDFGFYQLALGDLVWLDANNDGKVDPDETPISGVPVQLWLDADGDGKPDTDEPFAVTTTDENGLYRFTGLPEGNYLVSIPSEAWGKDAPLDGLASSTGDGGDPDNDVNDVDDGIDPENHGEAVWSGPITLSGGDEPGDPDVTGDTATNPTVDFGLYPLAGIGDYVWVDENRDGIQDEGEVPVEGIRVLLLDENGEVIGSIETDENGYYEFTNLAPGDYQVKFVLATLPDGYKVTIPNQGEDDGVDSDGDPESGLTESTTLERGEFDPNWDLGIHVRQAELDLVKVAPTDPIKAGDDVSWTINVTNTGPDAMLGGFTVVDELPGAMTAKSWSGDSWECEFDAQEQLLCDYDGDLEVGESASPLVVVTPTESSQAGLVVTNVARIDIPTTTEVVITPNDPPPSDPTPRDSTPIVLSKRTERTGLAFTGASTFAIFLAGASLTSAGAVMMFGGRKRRSASII